LFWIATPLFAARNDERRGYVIASADAVSERIYVMREAIQFDMLQESIFWIATPL
jgi:uncharacterized membrane protein (DUF485 family)